MREEKVRKAAQKLLQSGMVTGVIGLRKMNGYVTPWLFRQEDELSSLVLSPKYPLAITAKMVLRAYPEDSFGMVVRGCDERAVIELAKRNQLAIERLTRIGVACTQDEALECNCDLPYPAEFIAGAKTMGIPLKRDPRIKEMMSKSPDERLSVWNSHFEKCIKCYGCRNACPVCICDTCCLEEQLWIPPGEVPPEYPLFHLIRAFHISDKCIGCGECEAACPVDIPLTIIYNTMREELKNLFDYVAGTDIERQSPVITNLEQDGIKESRV